jgi:nucleotide-binding universal stress UspA family protein
MRILLAIDGSPSSIQARDLVAGLRWPAATTIRLATVCEPPIDWTGGLGAGMAWLGDAEEDLSARLGAELSRLAEPLGGHDWRTEWRVVPGRPATAIIDAAEEFGADVIVIGSRGRGPLTSMLLGSVSAEVAEHAPCSVLVARSNRISRLIIATDGSAMARAIPHLLGRLGVFGGLPAEALSVAPLPERTFELLADVYTLGAHDVTEDREALIERYRGFADELARRLRDQQIPATSGVAEGDAAHEIVAAARRSGADLIVTGTRGLRGVERALLGSVARNVLVHATCSVMVTRGDGPRPGGAAGH